MSVLRNMASFTAKHESGHQIIRHHDHWHVMSLDGQTTLKKAPSLDEAVAWCDTRFGPTAARAVRLAGAVSGELRTAELEGVEHVVVPVTALVGDITIWPVNAPEPELVPLDTLMVAPASWNGRPVCHNHPEVDGALVSANSPDVLAAARFGTVFYAGIIDGRLQMEAWIDPVKVEAIGGAAVRTLERLRANSKDDIVEVSVGCFVVSEERRGVDKNGRAYARAWVEVFPDHLAILEEGSTGACSVKAGCGAPRAAVRHLVTAQGMDWQAPAKEDQMADTPAPQAQTVTPVRSLRERVTSFLRAATSGAPAAPEMDPERLFALYGSNFTAMASLSDSELRNKLFGVLRSTEPAFDFIGDVYPDDKLVVYYVSPDGKWLTYRRSYTVNEDGTVTLGKKREQVVQTSQYEVVAAQDAETATPREAGCGCTKKTGETKSLSEEGAMTKTARAKALIENARSPFVAADQTYLEGLTDERLTELETHAAEPQPAAPAAATTEQPAAAPAQPEAQPAPAAAAAEPKELSEAEWLKTAPPSVRALVEDAKAKDAATRTALVASLKDAQEQYTEAELNAMSTSELEKLDGLVSALAGTDKAADYSGRAWPRSASANEPKPLPNGWFKEGKE